MIGIGLVGYGYWGPNLLRNLDSLEEARAVWCVDRDPARRNLAQRRYPSIKTGDDFKAILDDPDVHAVVIATPVSTHYPLAKQALAAGKHVFVEKPMARSTAEATELVEIAARNDLVLMVGHTFVYSAAVRKMKEMLGHGELGSLYYFDSIRINLGLFQHDIDVLWDLAPHDLSILSYLIPETPTHVSCVGSDHTGSGLVDMAYVSVFYPDSFMAHFHVNWLAPVKIRQLLIAGTRRMLVYDDLEPTEKVKIYDRGIQVAGDELHRALIDYRSGDMWAPKLDTKEPLATACAHFVECVRFRRMPASGGQAGLAVVRLLEAATRSLEQGGKRIAIPS